ncbi:hypothetical protein F5X96DRAFT_657545 [Biscogniauxia mediterranea]|nr:hypothetical protein F5X96DRAFT_657545 [Biscogniauxia mediterranea]
MVGGLFILVLGTVQTTTHLLLTCPAHLHLHKVLDVFVLFCTSTYSTMYVCMYVVFVNTYLGYISSHPEALAHPPFPHQFSSVS